MIQLLLYIGLLCLSFKVVNGISVEVSFYQESSCATSVNSITYDMATCNVTSGHCDQDCFTWERSAGSTTHINGAAHFQCYAGWGILYTQWVSTGGCPSSDEGTAKESRIGCCIAEPSGLLWSKITSTHENAINSCPPPPEDLPAIGDCTPIYEVTGTDGKSGKGKDGKSGKMGGGTGGLAGLGIDPQVLLILIVGVIVICCCICFYQQRQAGTATGSGYVGRRMRSSSIDDAADSEAVEMAIHNSLTELDEVHLHHLEEEDTKSSGMSARGGYEPQTTDKVSLLAATTVSDSSV